MPEHIEDDCDERSGIGPEGVRMLFDPTYKFTMIPAPVVETLRQHVLDSLKKPLIYRDITRVETLDA
jgi:hypothetical protein